MQQGENRLGPGGRDAFAAILIADDAMTGEPLQALALAGGRLMTRIGWDAVPQHLGGQAGRPVILLETQGAGETMLGATLPRVDTLATALDLSVVVVLEEATIDVVAASLLGANIHLLCRPTMAERVAAIVLGADRTGDAIMHETWREGEAVRLQRLNQEVARIAEVLARLTRREGLEPDRASGAAIADRRDSFDPGPDTSAPPAGPIDAAEIRRAIRARRLRDQFFGTGLFEDPAWDMLLDLFAAELEGAQVSVSSLCIAAAVAPTTALRWIGKMTGAGLFLRQADPFDRRRAFMALSDGAREGMRGYVAAAKRAGLAVA